MADTTRLHMAAERGLVDVVESLILHGADVDARDRDRRTPLHLAADCGQVRVAEVLIAHGADVDAREAWGGTPLHQAAPHHPSVATLAMVELLLRHGALVDASTSENLTPLHLNAQSSAVAEVAELLVAHGADVHARSDRGATPLHFTTDVNGASLVATLLLDKGADVHRGRHVGNPVTPGTATEGRHCIGLRSTRNPRTERWGCSTGAPTSMRKIARAEPPAAHPIRMPRRGVYRQRRLSRDTARRG